MRLKAVDVFNKMPAEAKYKLVPDLMVAMSHEEPLVRGRAAKILGALGIKTDGGMMPDAKQALPEEKKALPEVPVPASPVAQESELTLEEIRKDKPKDAYSDLRDQLKKEKEDAGFADAKELRGQSGFSAAAYPLLEALKAPDSTMQIRAARRIGELRPPPAEAIPLLEKMLASPDKEARAAAAGALGGFGLDARSAAPTLMSLLRDEDKGVAQIAADALKQIQEGH